MDQETTFDRELTVAGLVAKQRELSLALEEHREAVKRLTLHLYHISEAILILDPKASIVRSKPKNHGRAKKGSIKRFVLTTLRESSEPMTSRQLAELWTHECGYEPNETTINAMRRRVTSCIKASVNQGLLEDVGMSTDHDANGPYKLWRVIQ